MIENNGTYINIKCHNISAHLNVSPGEGPSAWAGAAAFPLVFWRSQGAFNQSHVAKYSISANQILRSKEIYIKFQVTLTLMTSWPFQKLQVSPKPKACWVPPFLVSPLWASFQDISDSTVLRAAAEQVGLNGAETLQRSEELRGTIQQRYEDLTELVLCYCVWTRWFMVVNCRCFEKFLRVLVLQLVVSLKGWSDRVFWCLVDWVDFPWFRHFGSLVF